VADLEGARDFFLYNLPDNRFDTLPLLDVIKIIRATNRADSTESYLHYLSRR